MDFDFGPQLSEDQTEGVLHLISLVGAGLLAWKLSPDLSTGLVSFAGWLAIIEGAILLVQGTFDAWQEGLNWDNLTDILMGTGTLVAGLGVIFGKTGLAVGLVATGVLNLITAFHDMMENGMNWQNTLLAIAGLLGAGLGISLLTGSFIPMLIAGVASIILALVQWSGQGEEFVAALKLIFGGFADFFTALVNGDLTAAGEALKQVWEGIKAAGAVILAAIQTALAAAGAWLREKLGELGAWILGKLQELWTGLRQAWGEFWSWLGGVIGTAVTWVTEKLLGLVTWITEKLKELISGILLRIAEFGTSLKNKISEIWTGIKQGIKDFVNGGISMFENFINFIIDGVNGLISKLNSISASFQNPFSGETVTIGFHLKPIGRVSIPRLAAGAVIPPNRAFMAVLGDQRHGSNLEAPEGLIRKIVREESGGAAILPELREILAAIREGKTLMVDKRVLGRTVQESITSAARAGGTAFIPGR